VTVRISYEPIVRITGRWWQRRWHWLVFATRGDTYLEGPDGFCYTRIGATIARDRAAARLRRTHGGGA
jgi:hypothetical protein